jgi:hypothetical protein
MGFEGLKIENCKLKIGRANAGDPASLESTFFQFSIFNLRFAIFIATLTAVATSAAPALIFTSVPDAEVFQDSLARFVVVSRTPGAKLPDSCRLYRSPSPAGDQIAGHPTRVAATAKLASDSASVTFGFKAADKDTATGAPVLALGVHFLVAACSDSSVTPEFPLRVVTRQAPSFLSPKALETSASPNISWTPVPGVPAYHVLLSDQPLKIDPDKGSVDGASVIWQAITAKTSIAYGTPDPSGNFSNIPAPPLSPGVTYNLVLLDNYDGRSTLATSAKAQTLKLFSIQGEASPLAKPRNVAPGAGKILSVITDPSVTFRWTAAKASDGKTANTYKAFVYSREKQDAAEVLIPIWQSEVTDTFAVMDARHTLLDKTYIWKVFALSDAGTGVVGDTTSFTYHNSVQTLTLVTRSLGSAGDTVALGDVRVDVAPLNGSADPLPVFTLESGRVNKDLAVGGYALTFTKAGYATQKRNATLDDQGPLTVTQFLPPSPGRVSGRAVDAAGLGLDNVTVTGVGAGGKTFTATSDAQGFFLLGTSQGSLALSLAKNDYTTRDTTVTLKAGQNLDIGSVRLAQPQGALSGTIANEQGSPLSGCRVDVKTSGGATLRTLLTDDKGAYSALLAPGAYIVAASRLGFASGEKNVQLSGAARVDFTLASGASVLKGRVTAKARPTAGTTQSAPLAEAQLELKDARGTIRKGRTDLRGDYSFSVDTGQYQVKVIAPGKTAPDSVIVQIDKPRSTLTRDIEVGALASVQGILVLTPPAPVNPALVTVSLLKSPSLALFASVTPSSVGGAIAWSLDGVPDGAYRLTCGLPGYGPSTEPQVTVAGGVWVTGVEIPMKVADKSLTFNMARGAEAVTGTIRLLTPEARDLEAGKKLSPTASGTYTFDAVPDSLDLLPIAHHTFELPAVGAADTTVTLPLAFSHTPRDLTLAKGVAGLVLRTPAKIDEAFVVFGYGAPADTLRLTQAQADAAGDSVTFAAKPGNQGGELTYYFVVRSGAYVYSNEAPDRRFHAQVGPSLELAYLDVSLGDTLRLPAKSLCEIVVHAYDAGGRLLDSLVDERGRVAFSAGSHLPVDLQGKAARRLLLATGGAQPPLAKTGQAGTAAKAGAAGSPTPWDNVAVTVVLDSVQKTLKLPARVVPGRINKLVVGSTLGDAQAIPSPAPFGLFITGFDTTATPPLPLVPNPEVFLDPPEAGVVSEQQVTLDPRFIGPVRVLARHVNGDGSFAASELGAGRDSLLRGVNVGQTLAYGDTARLFTHDPQFEIEAPDSLLAGPGQAVLRVYRRALAKSFTSGVTDVVAGRIYEISNPSDAAFAKPLRLRLGIPQPYLGRAGAIKRFDTERLAWKDLPDSGTADLNAFGRAALSDTVDTLDGSYYALISRSKSLSAGALDIMPNPFSPLVLAARDGNTQYGARIRLRPESDKSAEVTVSVRVYNLDGELVRLLIDHKTIPKAPVDFYWDGKTDSGRWARNGRYVVKVTLTATGTRDVKQVIKPVVVYQ